MYPTYPTMNPGPNPQRKRYIILGAVLVFLLLVFWLVYNLLTTSHITILTNDKASTISIQETSPQYKTIKVGTGQTKYKLDLHKGSYTVNAKDNYASAQQIITLGTMGHSRTVTINVDTKANQLGALENVTDLGAHSIIADASSIRFIDSNQSPTKLYQIDASNTLTPLANGVSFDSISWADISFGIGKAGTTFLAINGTNATILNLPITATTYAVAPNHDVYISDGASVYRGAGGTKFTRVFNADSGKQLKVMAASNNSVLLSSMSSGSDREGDLISLHKNGSKDEIDGEAYEGAWTASGAYLAISGDTNGIFNDKLQKVADTPLANVNALAWINNDTLAYADNNLVWRYTVSSRQANVLVTTRTGVGSVSEIAPSSDGSSLYISVQNPSTVNGFSYYLTRYRFNTTPTTNPVLQKVSLVLPNTPMYGCSVGYVNFTKLTVTATADASIQQACIAATQSYLQSYDIDPNTTPIQFIPA